MNAPNEICYLADEGGKYIGFIHVTIRKDYLEGATGARAVYIEGIYVIPVYQQLGVGKRLVQAGEDRSRKKGWRQLASETEGTNTADIAFHKSADFEEANRVICIIKSILYSFLNFTFMSGR